LKLEYYPRTRTITNTEWSLEKAMEKIHVNLVDLVCEPNNIRIFATEVDLSDYTIETGKILPKKKAGGLLKYLLRHIENPSMKRGASHARGKHRRR
jgi:hypothetical protein